MTLEDTAQGSWKGESQGLEYLRLQEIILVGPELLEPWPGSTWASLDAQACRSGSRASS